jgi:hypothetical protein
MSGQIAEILEEEESQEKGISLLFKSKYYYCSLFDCFYTKIPPLPVNRGERRYDCWTKKKREQYNAREAAKPSLMNSIARL